MTGPAQLSVVIVTHRCAGTVGRTLELLREQLGSGDELMVVDNASGDGTVDAVRAAAPEATVVLNAANDGFAAAANLGAARARGDLLVFLNPDTEPEPGFAEAIRRPLADGRAWDAWMGLVLAEGGAVVNTSGGVVHFTGIAWAGEYGRGTAGAVSEPREVAFVSGACLAVPRAVWEDVGGFPPDFFMYCEDVDLSLRLRLRGGRLGVEPAARVHHDYSFHKGTLKWRLLERNRWATIVRTYPRELLLPLLPALVLTDVALVFVALVGGWARQKLLATGDVLRSLPRLRRERRAIQATRTASARDFARWLTPELSSPYLGRPGRSRLLGLALRAYWRLVLALLRRASSI